MSRTKRNKSYSIRLGDHLGRKEYWNGKVRDGTPTRYTKSCENNGGCGYCTSNRTHSTNRRKPLEEE